MKIIDFNLIQALNISPKECVNWVSEGFRIKMDSILPAKNSIAPFKDVFYNTMPCFLPAPINRFGLKEVTRYPLRHPSLNSQIMLYNGENGKFLALMDGDWITAMRTGAVAALTIKTLRSRQNSHEFAFMGLGNTARATLLCLLDTLPDKEMNVRVLSYKNQENKFIERFNGFKKVRFSVVKNVKDLISDADVIVSCITAADGIIADDNWFKEGVLLVPVHTRGFQNCDLFFDKVFADDFEHVKGFKYFDRFKEFDELGNVLSGKNPGRVSDQERVLSYNIGIAIHDILFASKIYALLESKVDDFGFSINNNKFWV